MSYLKIFESNKILHVIGNILRIIHKIDNIKLYGNIMFIFGSYMIIKFIIYLYYERTHIKSYILINYIYKYILPHFNMEFNPEFIGGLFDNDKINIKLKNYGAKCFIEQITLDISNMRYNNETLYTKKTKNIKKYNGIVIAINDEPYNKRLETQHTLDILENKNSNYYINNVNITLEQYGDINIFMLETIKNIYYKDTSLNKHDKINVSNNELWDYMRKRNVRVNISYKFLYLPLYGYLCSNMMYFNIND